MVTKCLQSPKLHISRSFTNLIISYLQGGVQVNTPWDAEISQHIKENLVPWEDAWREGTESEFSRSIYMNNIIKWVDVVVNYAVSH